MSSSWRRFVAKSAACVIASLACAAVLLGQERPAGQAPPRRPAITTVNPPPRETDGGGVYASKKQPQRVASGTRTGGPSKINQFMPQPRRPQASWGVLSAEQEAQLDKVLLAWEQQSAQVKTLECTFTMWSYMKALSNNANEPNRICRGVILYAAPDKGHYQIKEEAVDPAAQNPQFKKKESEHWVCDGNAVYEFNQQQKKLYERRLPAELKGKAISNSPLPFVFGTTAMQMRQRYWMRVTTPPNVAGREVWLKIEPIFAEDRANYQEAKVVLDKKKYLPRALGLLLTNGDRTNYSFDTDSASINNALKGILNWFKVPPLPSGWQRIVEDPPGGPAPPPDVQTLRLKTGIKRK